MKPISSIAKGISPSATMAIDSMAKQMKASGIDVISFGAGEPDFNTPDHIKEAGITAIKNNQTRYTPSTGVLPLREAICDRILKDTGVHYAPSQICVTSGAKHNVYIALQAIINAGEEVILPAPYWVTYAEAIRMAGGVPVIVETTETTGFKLTPEMLSDAITPRTKAVILTNPSNPTGMVYDREELQALANVIQRYDLYVISDEIYYMLCYDKPFVSIAGAHYYDQRCIQVLCDDRLAYWLCCCQCRDRQGDEQLSEPFYRLSLQHFSAGCAGRIWRESGAQL